MILLEAVYGSGLGALVVIIFGIMAGPAILLFILAAVKWKTKKELAKKLLLAGFLYLLIAGGICGIMVN